MLVVLNIVRKLDIKMGKLILCSDDINNRDHTDNINLKLLKHL